MNTLDKALHQITLAIDRLEPLDENLSKLLALTTAAHQLLTEEHESLQQNCYPEAKANALSILESILAQKLYADAKENSGKNFQHIKSAILPDLQAAVHAKQ